jgi:alkanesulfonate monooxygenase SsuD/methylene tetrahydromethanopterin reductase-like flavin-dependent oxidoreductase (luciferase family)
MHYIGRGRLENPWAGSPKDIADRLEEWFTERACDGCVVGPTCLPGTFEEFMGLVIPELQRRGVYRKEYAGTTRRDHLGLARPEVGAWGH